MANGQSSWKWDAAHVIIVLAFLVGFGWSLSSFIAAQLATGQPFNPATLVPLILVAANQVWAFFKSPPSNPADALQEGESATGSGGPTLRPRGFGEFRLLALLAFGAMMVPLWALLYGCTPTARQQAANTIAPAVSCVEQVTVDLLDGDTPAQILAALATAMPSCVQTIDDIDTIALGSKRVQDAHPVGYLEARTRRGLP